MQQVFEYYEVDPDSWRDIRRLDNIISASVSRNSDSDTFSSAQIRTTGLMKEQYIRVYLVVTQNGVTEKFPIGTFLAQTPHYQFDGYKSNSTIDCYSPLIELKENHVDFGYYIKKNVNVLESAYRVVREHTRAPVVSGSSNDILSYDFISEEGDTWFKFVSDLIGTFDYSLITDEMGRVLFKPSQFVSDMRPTWTFTDDNSSILCPSIEMTNDIYGIPNVLEITYSDNFHSYHSIVANEDPTSETSIQTRGRRILRNEFNPSIIGEISQDRLDEYARKRLEELSTVRNTVTYSHGYCPVNVGDCVLIDYRKAGIKNTKALVTSQSISCSPGASVVETAVFETKLFSWR